MYIYIHIYTYIYIHLGNNIFPFGVDCPMTPALADIEHIELIQRCADRRSPGRGWENHQGKSSYA